MPQLHSIDEVVEVPEPVEEAVRIPVEALMSEALGNGERTADLRLHRDVRRGADAQELMRRGCLQMVVDTIGPDGTNEANEEWAFAEEPQVVEQATENLRIGACMRCTIAARWVARKPLRRRTQ